MSVLIAFTSGLSCKTYDDLKDNKLLKQYCNETVMEFLKGLHYISFTATSLEDPLFCILFYITGFFYKICSPTSFIENYESSLCYSFGFLLLILNYNKFTNLEWLDIFILLLALVGANMETLVSYYLNNDAEYSFTKLFFRTISVIYSLLFTLFVKSNACKYILYYGIGYYLVSIIVQWYSLTMTEKNNQKKQKKQKKQNKNIKKNTLPISSITTDESISKITKVTKGTKNILKKEEDAS
jgi:hypothetical protein